MRYLIVLCLFIVAGCATTESLEKSYSEINREDGINRDEAGLIAKKWLVESQYEGDFQVIGPVATTHGDMWRVSFLYKSLSYYEKVLDIDVDKKTGEVTEAEIRARETPAVTKDPWDTFNQGIKIPNSPDKT